MKAALCVFRKFCTNTFSATTNSSRKLSNSYEEYTYSTNHKNCPWVYKEEDGYNETLIEERFNSISKGGSIDINIDNHVAVVTINNPAKRNAFTGSMLVELQKVTKQLWNWDEGKAVVLCGAEDNFCYGLDLSLAKQLTEPMDGENMCMYMQNTLTLFQTLPMITVAAIKGNALGGGAEVATAADLRLMFPQSRIQFVHKKMGIIPGWGGVTRLRRIVGSRKVMHLLASSESLDSKTCLLIGLADALASETKDTTVSNVVKEWLEQTYELSKTDASVYRAIKTAAYDYIDTRTLPMLSELQREKDVLTSVWGKEPNKAALNKVKS